MELENLSESDEISENPILFLNEEVVWICSNCERFNNDKNKILNNSLKEKILKILQFNKLDKLEVKFILT